MMSRVDRRVDRNRRIDKQSEQNVINSIIRSYFIASDKAIGKVRYYFKLTQINLSYRGLHSDVPPVCCEVSRALIRRGLATLARLRTEATCRGGPYHAYLSWTMPS